VKLSESELQGLFEECNVPVFLSKSYLNFVLGEDGWSYALSESQGIRGIYFYHKKKKVGLDYITMHPLVKYMGPYFTSTEDTKICNELTQNTYQQIPTNNFIVQQWHPKRLDDCAEFLQYKKAITKSTFVLDLTKELSELLEQQANNNRRSIQKYNNEYTSYKDTEVAYELITGVLPNPKMLGLTNIEFVEFVDFIEREKIGEHTVWEYQGEAVASNVVLYDKSIAYYLMAGNKRISGSSYPGLQAVWQTIKKCKTKGVQKIDFLGSSIPSIAAFWRKLGAKEVGYPYFEEIQNPLFSAMKKIKKWM